MASSFKAAQDAQQQALLRRLITQTLGVQDGEENFQLALEFCTSNLKPKLHSYKDVDSKEVGRQFDKLALRLEQHSQLTKADALRQHARHLCSLGLPEELDASLLCLLFNIAQSPLSTHPTWLQRSTGARAAHDWEAQLATDEEWEGPALSDSPATDGSGAWSDDKPSLSDWTGDEASERSPSKPPHLHPILGSKDTLQPTTVQPAVAPQPHAEEPQPIGCQVHQVPVSLLPCADALSRTAAPTPGDLVPQLVQCRLGPAPLLGPKPDLCMTEQFVLHQICNVLLVGVSDCFTWGRGAPCSDPALVWAFGPLAHPDAHGAYHPVPGLHLPHLSQSMVADVLGYVARLGSQVAWVRTLVAAGEYTARAALGLPPTAPGAAPLTATCRALLQAAGAQLHALLQPVVALQQANRFPAEHSSAARTTHTGAHGVPGVSLLQCKVLLDAVAWRAQGLVAALTHALSAYATAMHAALASAGAATTAGSARAGDAAGGSASLSTSACAASSALLDALCARLDSTALAGGPRAQACAQLDLHLLGCALDPLLANLHAWLQEGAVLDPTDDFFVQPQHPMQHESSPKFWSRAYTLLWKPSPGSPGPAPQTSTGGHARAHGGGATAADQGVACPQFLQPLAHQVFSAGKALRLLRNGSADSASSPGMAALLAAVPGLLLQPSAPTSGTVGPEVLAAQPRVEGGRPADLGQRFQRQLRTYLSHFLTAPPASSPGSAHSAPGAPARAMEDGGTRGSGTSSFARMACAGFAMSSLQPWGSQPEPALAWQPSWSAPVCKYAAPLEEHTGVEQAAAGHTDTLSQPRNSRGAGQDDGNAKAQRGKDHGATHSDAAPHARDGQGIGWWENGAARELHTPVPSLGWTGFHRSARARGSEEASARRHRAAAQCARQGSVGDGGGATEDLVPKRHPHTQLAWLLQCPCVSLPPASQLLQHCLTQGMEVQVRTIEQLLLGQLLSGWGLLSELKALRNLYLLASPAAQAWAGSLLAGVLDGRALSQHQEYELEVALQEACAEFADPDTALPSMDCLSVSIDKARLPDARARGLSARTALDLNAGPEGGPRVTPLGGLHSVVELECLEVHYTPSWLMAILGGSQAVGAYNKVLVFLLQIHAARMALERTRCSAWKFWQSQARLASCLTTHARQAAAAAALAEGTTGSATAKRPAGLSALMLQQHQQQVWGPLLSPVPPPSTSRAGSTGASHTHLAGAATLTKAQLQRRDELALDEMFHFVTNLHQYVVDRLLYGAWLHLEQTLDKVSTLDELVTAHKTFMAELEHQSGKATGVVGAGGGAPMGAWRHLVTAIVKILDQVIRYCAGQQMLMQQSEALASSSAQVVPGLRASAGVSGAALTAANGPAQNIQESVALARQQMEDASKGVRHLVTYLTNFISAGPAKIGGDQELANLLMRIQFNGWTPTTASTADGLHA